MNEVHFIKSSRGGHLLEFANFLYRLRKKRNFVSYWRCATSANCKATVVLENNIFRKSSGNHDHTSPSVQIERKRFISRLKDRAVREKTVPVPRIYKEEVAKMAVSVEVPNYDSCEKVMYRARSSKKPRLPNPIEDLIIPDAWKKTTVGKDFLLVNDGDRKNRIFPEPSMHHFSQTDRGEKASPLPQSVKLHKSENPWKPRHKVKNPEVNPDNCTRIQRLPPPAPVGTSDPLMPTCGSGGPRNLAHIPRLPPPAPVGTTDPLMPTCGSGGPRNLIPDKSTDDFLAEALPVVKLRTFLKVITRDPGFFERNIQPLTQTLNRTVDDDETMRAIVNIIFDESVRQPNLRYSAARVCKALSNNLDVSPDRLDFRTVLLTRCNQEFSRRVMLALAEDGGEYLRGFAMFFAELFSQLEFQEQKIPVLAESLPNLIKTILYYDSPDNLKCACQILKLVGADLEVYERNRAVNNETTPDMDSIMGTLKKFVGSSDYEWQIKDRISGVINQRVFNWGRSLHTENSGYNTLPPTDVTDEVETICLAPGGPGLSSWGIGSSGGTNAPDDVKTDLTNSYNIGRHLGEPQENTKQLKDELVELDEVVFNGPELDGEEMKIKTKTLLEEFLHSKDLDKCIKCVKELVSPNTAHLFIDSAIYQVFGKSMQSRNMLGQLLRSLVEKNVITFDQYKKGFEDILKLQKKYFSEIMKVNKHLGEILLPLVNKDDSTSLESLKEVLKPCMGNSEEKETEYDGFVASCILQFAGIPEGFYTKYSISSMTTMS